MQTPKTWDQIINEAEARGYFEEREVEEASQWATCALGECLSTRTETYADAGFAPDFDVEGTLPEGARTRARDFVVKLMKEPTSEHDEKLYDLGMEFARMVERDRFDTARKILGELRETYKRAMDARKTDTPAEGGKES